MKTLDALKKLNGYKNAEVYLVGGFVRDLLRRKRNEDIDVVVRKIDAASINEFLSKYGTTKFINLTFDVSVILFKAFNDKVEAQITFPRNKAGKFDPFNSLKRDSECRDFTINSMYLPIDYSSRRDLIDYFGGYKDIKERLITAVKNADSRIKESPIRIMRALSLAARTKYRIDNDLLAAMRKNKNLLKSAPIEGIREELNKILLSSKPSRYFKIMRKIGVLDIILPELAKCHGVRQDKRHHKHDVFKHCLYTCDYIEPDLVLRIAAILHDIGKPDTKALIGDRITFHKHEIVSVELTVRALKRLKYKREIIDKASHLVKFHMYHYTRDFSDAAVRRFIKKIGITTGDLKDLGNIPLFKLRKAERKGNGYKTIAVTERQLDFENRIREVFQSSKGLYTKDLNIDGDTIMKIFNMEQSPKVGEVLGYLLEQILEKPNSNNMDDLIKMAAEFIYYKMK